MKEQKTAAFHTEPSQPAKPQEKCVSIQRSLYRNQYWTI